MNAAEPFTEGSCGGKIMREEEILLIVQIYRARDLSNDYVKSGCDMYVELRVGVHSETTKSRATPEWNQTFSYAKHKIRAPTVEIEVKGQSRSKSKRVFSFGRVSFDLDQISTSARPLSPHWYRLQLKTGETVSAELLLSIWIDDVISSKNTEKYHIYGKNDQSAGGEYVLPKFWYVRVSVIEAHDLLVQSQPNLYVLAMLGNQSLRTSNFSDGSTTNPKWNEELLFVASEPFEESLVLTVEGRLGKGSNNQVIGRCVIPLQYVPKRFKDEQVSGRWYDLSKQVIPEDDFEKKTIFSGKIYSSICVEAGYHVLIGSKDHYKSCDYMPPERTPCIGIMELHVIEARGLLPVKKINGRLRADTFCVVQYGRKWVRTRTVVDSVNPQWNDQFSWQIFDPNSIVTIGLFNDCSLLGNQEFKDNKFGKVRIHLSTLPSNQAQELIQNYPILHLYPSGLKQIGEIILAVRLTYSSWFGMLSSYTQPLLPIKHYLDPFENRDSLSYLNHSMRDMVARWFDQSEPRLRREVVEYMLDTESFMWSLRKFKASFSLFLIVRKWYDHMCCWKNPFATLWVHFILIILLLSPSKLPSVIFLSLSVAAILNYNRRNQQPSQIGLHPSLIDINLDELDEELDTFPTSRPPDVVKTRYDRLRNIAAKVQNGGANMADNLERVQNLVRWSDPRATRIFMAFCVAAAIAFYLASRVVVFLIGLYLVRHPRLFRVPLSPINFFSRLPTKADMML